MHYTAAVTMPSLYVSMILAESSWGHLSMAVFSVEASE